MITIIAVVGWLLFLLTGFLYWVGNRLNAQESLALATYSLALFLSDDFRSAVRAGFDKAIQEARSRGSSPQTTIYGLTQAVTENAKSCFRPGAEISTISIVTGIVNKQFE